MTQFDTALSERPAPTSSTARIAFVGEFSSGKSTAINTVIGAPILPTNVTATRVPPVWIAYGPEARAYDVDASAGLLPLADIDLSEADLRHYSGLRVERPLSVLRDIEVIDTPGISDPTLAEDPLTLALALADAVIWCTPANQAWRQTEVARWRQVPEDIRRRSLLLVTRTDVIGGKDSLEKLKRRLTLEAEPEFGGMLFFNGRAASALAATETRSGEAWHDSGAAALVSWVDEASRRDLRPERLEPSWAPIAPTRTETADRNADPADIDTNAAASAAPEIRNAEDPPAAPRMVQDRMPPASDPAETRPTTQTAQGQTNSKKELPMTKMDKVASTDISALNDLAGFIGACLVDSDSGLMLGSEGGANFDLEVAAAGNTEVVKAKNAAKEALGLEDYIEDILITLGTQYHLIRPLRETPSVFLYVALDKKAANLGMARMQVKKVENSVSM